MSQLKARKYARCFHPSRWSRGDEGVWLQDGIVLPSRSSSFVQNSGRSVSEGEREREMEVAKEKEGDENPTQSQAKSIKGKSCKGCLYYSSALKSKSRNPLCVGLARTVQVHGYVVGKSEVEASKEGRSLTDFKYGCLGYSVYLDGKDSSNNLPETQADLPVCLGVELLVDKRVSTADNGPDHVRAPLHNKEDGRGFPPPRTQKPAHSVGDEFLSRFTRNASLVAVGVAKNMVKVGNYMKDSLDDILFPYRRRPK